MALSEYDKKYLTKEQQTAILKATEYGETTGDWKTAHTMAEAVRGTADYSGGDDGSGYIQGQRANASYIDADGNKQPGYTTGDTDYDAMMQQARDDRDRAVAANDALYAAQLQQQQNNLNGQIDRLNASYDNTGKQLYRDYMSNQKNLPQSLAAQGIHGGLAESSLIRLANSYEESLNGNEQERALALNELQSGLKDAELQLELQRTQGNSNAESDLYSRINAIMLAAKQAQEDQKQREEAQRREDEQLAYTRALQEAQLASSLGDSSKLYDLLGVAAPTSTTARQTTDIFDSINQLVADGAINKDTAIAVGKLLAGSRTPMQDVVQKPSGSGLYNQYLISQAAK